MRRRCERGAILSGLARCTARATRGATHFGAAMQDLAARALDTAQVLGASYADVRVERRESQSITVKNGHVDGLSDDTSQGFGVRVVVDGGWGFASSARL